MSVSISMYLTKRTILSQNCLFIRLQRERKKINTTLKYYTKIKTYDTALWKYFFSSFIIVYYEILNIVPCAENVLKSQKKTLEIF